jgi:3-phenylpropionate/trans-cinnamate dioxygenase ferredoxin subunit
MSEFTKVAVRDDLASGEKMIVEADDRIVILFRDGDDFYCIDDVCTHDGGTLSDGSVHGCQIECPRHGARFDMKTGKALCMPAYTDTAAHEVKLDGDDVLVRINDD